MPIAGSGLSFFWCHFKSPQSSYTPAGTPPASSQMMSLQGWCYRQRASSQTYAVPPIRLVPAWHATPHPHPWLLQFCRLSPCARSFPGKGRPGSGQTLLHGGRRRGWGVSLCSALSRPAWGAQVLGTYPPTPPDPLFGHFLGVCCSVSPCATLLVSNHVATTWPTAPRPPCHHSPLGAPCILLLLRLPCRKRAPGQPRTQRRGFPILVVLPRAVQEEPQEDFILSERVTSHPSAARWH